MYYRRGVVMKWVLSMTFVFFSAVIYVNTEAEEAVENGPYPSDDNTVLLMHFDEGSGEPTDSCSYGNPGVNNGAVWTASGRFGSALNFDGKTAHVSVPHTDSLNITGALTLEAWVKLDSYPGHDYYWVVGKQNAYELAISAHREGQLVLFLKDVAGAYAHSPALGWETGRWYHVVALSTDGTTEGVRFYRDGVELSTTVDVSGSIASNDKNVYIGAHAGAGYRLAGTIDEVRISNTARTMP